MKKIIHTDKAPKALGPYSQAVESGGFLFCSGQIAINPETNQVFTGPIEQQTTQVLENIRAVLTAAGLAFQDVVKATVYLVDMNDFATVNEVYGRYFNETPPVRTTIAVAALPKGVHVEIEVIAKS